MKHLSECQTLNKMDPTLKLTKEITRYNVLYFRLRNSPIVDERYLPLFYIILDLYTKLIIYSMFGNRDVKKISDRCYYVRYKITTTSHLRHIKIIINKRLNSFFIYINSLRCPKNMKILSGQNQKSYCCCGKKSFWTHLTRKLELSHAIWNVFFNVLDHPWNWCFSSCHLKKTWTRKDNKKSDLPSPSLLM